MSLTKLVAEPAIHVRIRPECDLAGSQDSSSYTVRFRDGRKIRCTGYDKRYEPAHERLLAGAPLAELRHIVLTSAGKQHAEAWFGLLWRLCQAGILEFPLMDKEKEQAVIVPLWDTFVPSLTQDTPAPGRRFDRFVCVRPCADGWFVESPLCGARIAVGELAALEKPLVRRALAALGLLEAEQAENGPRRDILAQWEYHDLLFHTRHRMGWHHDIVGGAFPFIGEIDPPPARRPNWPGVPIELPRAPEETGAETFASVLERRCSERPYDDFCALTIGDLGALLDRSARVRSSHTIPVGNLSGKTAFFEITRRSYPSGGSSHELEIYPVVRRCDGLEPGMYHYDAFSHTLTLVRTYDEDVRQVIKDAQWAVFAMTNPQVVLAVSARFARVMWKYRSISYGNILRDTGVLYQTLYLAATELGLSPCALGTGNSALFARITGLDPLVEGSVGEFLVGGKSGS